MTVTTRPAMPGWACHRCGTRFRGGEPVVPVARPLRAVVTELPDAREVVREATVTGFVCTACPADAGADR